MTSTYPAYSFLQAIARNSNGRALLGLSLGLTLSLILGCSEQPAEQTSGQAQVIPPLGATTSQTAPLSLKVRVDLSAIKSEVAANAKVYVFVREPGERMPLGVEQFTVDTLPPEIEFTTINNYSTVSVIARVSPSGKVEKSAEDFEASVVTNFGHPAPVVNLSFATDSNTTQGATAAVSNSGNSMSSITVNIELAVPDSEMVKLSEHSRLFVIAKGPGSPVPLAVKAYPIDAIPEQLTLSDADAMMPSRPLSAAKKIVVSARISRSGDVSRDTGDWEGLAPNPDSNTPNQFKIRVDQRID